MIEIDDRRSLRSFGQSAIERVRTNSAMNPLLWLNGCSLPFTITGAIWAPTPVNYGLLAIAVATILASVIAYFIWMFRDPNRLQSEDYQLENQRMLLGDERHPGVLIDGKANIPAPKMPSLEGQS